MANIFRYVVTVEHPASGTLCQSTVHYRTDVPLLGSEPSSEDLLDEIDQHFSTSARNMNHWRNVMSSELRVVKSAVREEVTPGSGDVPAVAENTYSLAGLISSAGESLPIALCPWIKMNTGQAIRSARGGTHAPPALFNFLLDTDRLWDTGTGWWTSMEALATKVADSIDNVFSETGDINPGIYSRTRRQRGQSPFFFELTGAAATRKPRWLRRRETSP